MKESVEQRINNFLSPKAVDKVNPDTKVQPDEMESVTESPEVQKFKVGDEELTWDELVAGRLRQKDYTTKTQKLSEERKAFEAQALELKAKLEDAKYILETELNDLNSAEMLNLKETNPNKYWKEVEKLQTKVKKFESLKQRELEKQQKEEQDLIESELLKLKENVQEWKDPESFRKDQVSLLEVLQSVGYDQHSIDKIKDHRVLLLAKKAMAYDNLMNSKPDSKKIPVAGKSSNPTRVPVETDGLSGSLEKLKKTGKTKDSIEAIKQLLSKK